MLRKLLITTAAAIALPLSAPSAWADSSELTVDELMQQVEWLQVQMSTLLKQVDEMKGETVATAEKTDELAERTDYLEEDVEDLDDRLIGAGAATAALDAIRFGGDFRTQAHNISVDMVAQDRRHQRAEGPGQHAVLLRRHRPAADDAGPERCRSVHRAQNYDQYLYYLDNTVVSFDFIKQQVEALQQMDPAAGPAAARSVWRPSRTASSRATTTITTSSTPPGCAWTWPRTWPRTSCFEGRLGMYKVWGDSSNVQVFNGQPTSIGWDGTTVGVPPSSDIIRLERGYFTWSDIADLPMYLSIGRRPSTGGAPLNFREDEPRGGTPIGRAVQLPVRRHHLGLSLNDYSTFRICYGLGYESEWGNGSEYLTPSDRLDDTWFVGAVWDVFNTDDTLLQLNLATAQDYRRWLQRSHRAAVRSRSPARIRRQP